MKTRSSSLCGTALLLAAALISELPARAQSPAAPTVDSAVTAAEVKQLRQALAAQQQQIAELQAKIEALTRAPESRQQQPAPDSAIVPPQAAAAPDAALQAGVIVPQELKATPQQASDSIVLAGGKIKIGATVFSDWSYYTQTGFGPAFLDTPHVFPGPGNDGYNAFSLNRIYTNFLFSPRDWVTFRLTPDIYRDINSAGGQRLSATSGAAATPNGSLSFRLKYAYAEFTKIFSGSLKDDNFRFGQQPNPLIDWEEGLYGYRFVNLVPWNFVGLSSTYTGISLNGPIKGSNGKQYLDYQIGVFNNSNYNQYEMADTKTGMARISLYPMGALSRFQGVGLTGFFDFGYNNAAPDTASKTPVVRSAALIHYQSPHNGAQIAFEYDYGRNAFGTGNLFRGSAPLDSIGFGPTVYAGMSQLASAVLTGRNTKQEGYAVFGHLNLGRSKWSVFGTYQLFKPNTNVPDDPFDFRRIVAGVSFTANKNVRLAVDSQKTLYTHDQFTYPASSIVLFSPNLALSNPLGIPSAVPPSVQAILVNMEFTF